MGNYFVACLDAGVNGMEAAVVTAERKETAIQKYLEQVLAFSKFHREDVLDRSINMSFAERFFITSTQESQRFREDAKSGTERERSFSAECVLSLRRHRYWVIGTSANLIAKIRP